MATTNFTQGTVIASAWLNEVDAAVYETLPKIGIHINQFSPAANGTAATDVRVPLPFTATSDGVGSAIAGYEGTTGVTLGGYIGPTLAYLRILKYDATYPGADNRSLQMTGRYRRA